MKKFKLLFVTFSLTVLLVFSGIMLNIQAAGANVVAPVTTAEEKVAYDLNAINLPKKLIAGLPITTKSVYGSTIEYASNNEDVICTDVVKSVGWLGVIRDQVNTYEVTVTVTVTNEAVSDSKEFEITVPAGTTVSKNIEVTFYDAANLEVQEKMTIQTGTWSILPIPEIEGYLFKGWYNNEEYTGNAYFVGLGLLNDVTLYANMEEIVLVDLRVNLSPEVTFLAFDKVEKTMLEVLAIYSDGTEVEVDEYEITYQNGVSLQAIDEYFTITYGELFYQVNVEVQKISYDMNNLIITDSFVYNGLEQTVSVSGVPTGVSYQVVGSGTNADQYLVVVNFSVEDEVNYNVPESLNVTLEITKAVIDMSEISLNDDVVEYNGLEQVLNLNGILMPGVTVEISGGGTDASITPYQVIATFTLSDELALNYQPIAEMVAYITINKANPEITVQVGQGPYFVGSSAPVIYYEEEFDGQISWDDEYVLEDGENLLAWTFTPADLTNYNVLNGTKNITAVNTTISSIEVLEVEKNQYISGETADLASFTVIANYSDSSSTTLNNEDVEIIYENEASNFLFGHTTFTVKYGTFTYQVTGITVSKININVELEDFIVTYNGQAQSINYQSYPEGVVNIIFDEYNTLTNVGEVILTVQVVYGTEYTGQASVNVKLVVQQANVIITPNALSKVIGDVDPELTYSAFGLVDGEELAGVLTREVGEGFGTYKYTVNNLQENNPNYKIVLVEEAEAFTINKISISDMEVEEISNQEVEEAEGFEALTPKVVIVGLEEDTDYTVNYTNNTVLGMATITINGMGNYEGQIVVNFMIVLSDSALLAEAVKEIEDNYIVVDTDDTDKLPLEINGVQITWMNTNTTLIINPETGALSVVKTSESQSLIVVAMLVIADYVEYIEIEVGISAEVSTAITTYDFVTKFATYATSWNNQYSARTVASSALGTYSVPANFELSAGSKQSSSITDRPVVNGKGGSTVEVSVTGLDIVNVTFNVKQWGSDAVSVSIEYQDADSNWVSCSDTKTVSGDDSIANNITIPAGVSKVRLYVYVSGTSNKRIGLTSIVLETK